MSALPPAIPPRPSPQAFTPRQSPLPNPEELSARIEEARNSAKLLTQFVDSTPPIELENNDLVKEFLDRCRTGARIIQGYIHTSNPPPDEDTLLTLIETNDEISTAISLQQRAMLNARKLRGSSSPSSSNVNSPEPVPAGANLAQAPAELPNTVMTGGRVPAAAPAPAPAAAATAAPTATASSSRYEYNSEDFQVRNPFADDYATDEGSGRQESDRVRFQPTEHER
jgi:hypothetical protein